MPPALDYPRSPITHDRNPECIEAIAEVAGRVTGLERWQERQNGTLDRMAEILHLQGQGIARMDEKLSALIVRHDEDRRSQADVNKETLEYRKIRQEKEEAPATVDGRGGFLREMVRRYPLGVGLLLGAIMATVLVLGSDWLRSSLSQVIDHQYGTPALAPGHDTPAAPGR